MILTRKASFDRAGALRRVEESLSYTSRQTFVCQFTDIVNDDGLVC